LALPLTLDYRFVDEASGLGVAVDTTLTLEVWESGASSATVTRVLGTDANTTIVQATDAAGVFYSSTVDVSNFANGTVTAKWFAQSAGVPLDPYPAEETFEYPTPPPLSFSSIKDYVFSMMGAPLVSVELTDQQLNQLIDSTLRKYNRYVPLPLTGNVTLISGVNAYPQPHVGSRGVVRVSFVRKLPDTLFTSPYFGREFPRLGTMPFDEFVLGRTHLESVRYVTGTDPDWRWDNSTKILYLVNGNYDGWLDPTQWLVTYVHYADASMEQVPLHHQDWFFRYVLANARILVGTNRNKFSGTVPMPSGAMTLDGAAQIQQGQAELAAAEEDIRTMGEVVPPARG